MKWILAESAKQGSPLPWQRGIRQTAARKIQTSKATGKPASS